MPGVELTDPYNLQRFLEAQAPIYESVCAELRAGDKRGHWMWFIFPQIKGLGYSQMAARYAIGSRAEAEAYLQHAILGHRLRECSRLVIAVQGRSIEQIFGSIDSLKFRSSMTLFHQATSDNAIFQEALQKYFGGKPDPLTLERL